MTFSKRDLLKEVLIVFGENLGYLLLSAITHKIFTSPKQDFDQVGPGLAGGHEESFQWGLRDVIHW